MSDLGTHVIGTDSVIVIPLTTENHELGTEAPTDITGAYVYFQIFDEGGSIILDLSNDPSGTNVGITVRSPATDGVFEAKIEHTDLAGATLGTVPFNVHVRLDPTGVDDRYDACDGTITLEQTLAVVV